MRRFSNLALLLCLWSSIGIGGERGAPLVQVYDLQETIGTANLSSQVYSLPDGRMFLSTIGGPAIFDGVRWRALNHPRKLGGFSWTERAADGRIHGAFNGDIGYWHEPIRGRWEWQSVSGRLPEAVRKIDAPRGIALQHGGRRQWYLTVSSLIRMDDAGGVSVLRGEAPFTGGWLVDDRFWVQDATGRVRVASADGELALTTLPGSAEALGQDANGRGYFIRHIVRGDGDWRMLLTDARILSYRDGVFADWSHAARELLMRKRVLSLARLSGDRWLIGSTAHGPVVLDARGKLLLQLDASQGVPVRATYDAFEDHQGGLWLAQERTLLRVDLGSGITQFSEAQGLPAGIEQLRRLNGDLYAIGGNYLYRLRPASDSAPAHFERVDGDNLRSVLGIAAAGEGLLICSVGVHEWRPDGAPARVLLPIVTSISLTPSHYTPGRYWLGELKGLQRLDAAADGQLQAAPMPLPWPAWQVLETDAQTLWAADRAGHLGRLTLSDPMQLREYTDKDGLPGGTVKIYPRREGGVWLATLHGIARHDPASDRIVSAEELPPELRSGRVFALLDDQDGNLWVRGDDLDVVAWRRPNGYELDRTLLRGVSDRPTIFEFLREGDVVWVARATGVLRIDLSARRPLPPAIPPFLSDVRLDGSPRRIDPAALAQLSSAERGLQLRFGAADLHRVDALQFRSQLAGFDSEFSAWTSAGERAYTNLPYGTYQFRLEARDGYGRISAADAIPVQIAAPWYLRGPAWGLWALLTLFGLWLAAQYGARRRQRAWRARQAELEREVAQRTEETTRQNQQLREQADALQEQAARLAQVDELKTRFFVNVGHEFRTPLTLVMGPIDDVLRDPAMRLGARARDLLELAQRNARRVLDLIIEMLDINKLEHGQLPLQQVPIDLTIWLPRQLDDLQALIDRHGHLLTLQLPGSALTVAIDPLQMTRVLGNLIGNAAKYMGRGGRIEVHLDAIEDSARLRVTDHGRGIAPAALGHVFDRFYRADEGEVGGHGVGLALAREIVERHGGRIGVTSELGVGSVFEIVLPRAEPATVASADPIKATEAGVEEAGSDPAPTVAPAPDRERPRVLVVDDHADLRLRLRQLLSVRYEVIEAQDGPGALHAAGSQLPDVVVADVMMPGFDGVELTRRLRADPETAAIGILLLTAKAGAEHAVVGLNAGADDYLAKPFDAAELLARVEALLAQMRRLQARLARQGLADALQTPATGVVDRDDARWRERLKQVITTRMHDPEFNVEALAQAMHLDRSALFRRLKQLGELAPAELLRERRLLQAQELLRRGEGSVTEIAFAVGFENLSSFTRAFRARFSCAPSSLMPGAAQRRTL